MSRAGSCSSSLSTAPSMARAGQAPRLRSRVKRIDPARSNLALMAREFWTNKMWRHGDGPAIFETILMAFLGTMSAALVALPLGFLAARNFSPLGPLRFAARRVFDFIRGVDGLIWTIILSRAFGPGPMTGAIAIAITDAGTFGKTFSEALENIDDRQVEGIRSTGANGFQRARFGVIPQTTRSCSLRSSTIWNQTPAAPRSSAPSSAAGSGFFLHRRSRPRRTGWRKWPIT